MAKHASASAVILVAANGLMNKKKQASSLLPLKNFQFLFGCAATYHDDGFDGSHSVIVVVLRRELLRAELEGGDHFLRALSVVQVPEGEEHDLSDECVVGNHHRHGAK